MRTAAIAALLLGLAALVLSACGPIHSVTLGHSGHGQVHRDPGDGHGPPPHAPAHGYRPDQEAQDEHRESKGHPGKERGPAKVGR